VAFFGCLYYAGMRPAEVVALRAGDCELPATGWGRLQLARSEPWAGHEWTDNGEARERRALKRRAPNTVRTVPIPAELVSLLRAHLETFGTREAGAVFRNERGGPFNEASARRAWPKHASQRSPRSRSTLRWRAGLMTFGTRRPRSGSTAACPPPR
jgi:integrase